MRILLLGGTAWLGHAIAETAIVAGHDVTCLARGGGAPAGAVLVQTDRDRDDALAVLPEGRWDAVVDVATRPGHVRRAVRDLAPHSDQYVFVSSCNAYASLTADGIDEGAPLEDPLTSDVMASPAEYGLAKVAGEQAVIAGFGLERSAIVGPGLIGGPGDPTGRTSYWPLRFARPSNSEGRVLVPDAMGQSTSMIDVRDLALWILRLAERAVSGVFNAAGDSIPLGQHLGAARQVAGHRGPLVLAPPEWLTAREVATVTGTGLDDEEERALLCELDQP